MPDMPGVPEDAAGLRAANARLRELLAERDAEVAGLRALVAELQAQVADLAARADRTRRTPPGRRRRTAWRSLPRSRCGRSPGGSRAGRRGSRVRRCS